MPALLIFIISNQAVLFPLFLRNNKNKDARYTADTESRY
jgi:hypothetical protein